MSLKLWLSRDLFLHRIGAVSAGSVSSLTRSIAPIEQRFLPPGRESVSALGIKTRAGLRSCPQIPIGAREVLDTLAVAEFCARPQRKRGRGGSPNRPG